MPKDLVTSIPFRPKRKFVQVEIAADIVEAVAAELRKETRARGYRVTYSDLVDTAFRNYLSRRSTKWNKKK